MRSFLFLYGAGKANFKKNFFFDIFIYASIERRPVIKNIYFVSTLIQFFGEKSPRTYEVSPITKKQTILKMIGIFD